MEEQLSLDWQHDQSLTTLLGFDGRAIRVGEANYSDNLAPSFVPGAPNTGVFDKDEYRIAGYGQQTWRPLQWLSLNAGARVDEDSRVQDDVHYGQVSPRGVAAINPWHNGTLRVIYSQAFRAPGYFETSFTDNQTVIPNLKLQPETVRSGEVSLEQRFGTQRVFLGGFYAVYEDMVLLTQAPTSALVAAVNAKPKPILMPPTPNTMKNVAATYGPKGGAVEQQQNQGTIHSIGVNAAVEGSALNKDLRYGLNVTAAAVHEFEPNPALGAPLVPCSGSTASYFSNDAHLFGANCTLPLAVAPQVFGNARIPTSCRATGRSSASWLRSSAGDRPTERSTAGGRLLPTRPPRSSCAGPSPVGSPGSRASPTASSWTTRSPP